MALQHAYLWCSTSPLPLLHPAFFAGLFPETLFKLFPDIASNPPNPLNPFPKSVFSDPLPKSISSALSWTFSAIRSIISSALSWTFSAIRSLHSLIPLIFHSLIRFYYSLTAPLPHLSLAKASPVLFSGQCPERSEGSEPSHLIFAQNLRVSNPEH